MATASDLMGVGVPAEVATRTGVTIVSVTCAGTDNSGATTVGGLPGNYCAVLTTGASTYCCILSSAFAPGDIVEFVNTSATTARIYPESGGTIDGGTATTGYKSVSQNNGLVLRKTAALTWKSLTGEETGLFDGVTAGTVTASKAVVVDANKDIGDFRNVDCVNLDAGASGTAGSVDVFPSTASKGKLAITCTDQTGDTTVSLVAGAMAAARTITLRDPGAAASILTTTDATAAATAATAVEITRACDTSARVITLNATSLSVTEATHDGRTIVMSHTAAGSTATLPAASGSGARFRFIVGAVNTNNHIIKVANASDVLAGSVNILDNDAAAQGAYAASGTDDTLTLNGTTTGGQVGDWVELEDIKANVWAIRGQLVVPAGSNPADPFSATVS